MAAWDRQPNEPPKAYAHFTCYRDAGHNRSLAKVGERLGISTTRLEVLSERHGWAERVDQWDAHLQAISDRALITQAAKAGRKRADAFTALLEKGIQALQQIDLSEATLSQVATAMKVATEGLRLEEGLATAHVTMELKDARFVLNRLPAEVRSGLCRILEERPDAGANREPLLALSSGD